MALWPVPRSSFAIERFAISGPGCLNADVVGFLPVVDDLRFDCLLNIVVEI